jgi:hypothetical protein
MGILNETREFVGKYINNPITVGVLSYLIVKWLSTSGAKEAFQESNKESIKIVYKDKNNEIIFDSLTNHYSLITNGQYIRSAKVLSTLQNNQESLKEDFKVGDIITRNESCQYGTSNPMQDGSYCGDRMILKGHDEVSKIIFFENRDF